MNFEAFRARGGGMGGDPSLYTERKFPKPANWRPRIIIFDKTASPTVKLADVATEDKTELPVKPEDMSTDESSAQT